MNPQKFRELVLQALFSIEMDGDEVLPLLMHTLMASKKVVKEGILVANEVLKEKKRYDQKICDTSNNYELDRIPLVEKNILRYALYEIEHKEPTALVTHEAVRLARKFSTPEAGTFINAILNELHPQEEQVTS